VKPSPFRTVAAELRAYALTFPGSFEDFPWGHSAFKAKGKVFLFLYAEADHLNVSLKLTTSHTTALDREFAEPTGYGLGKSGWVTSKFEGDDRVPTEVLKPWIEESYRAVAPKTLVKQLDAGGAAAAPAPTATPAHGRSKSARRSAAPSNAARKGPTPKKAMPRKSKPRKPAPRTLSPKKPTPRNPAQKQSARKQPAARKKAQRAAPARTRSSSKKPAARGARKRS
jgi:predicted DNA-binding protein (MmcQ/YjbR family)